VADRQERDGAGVAQETVEGGRNGTVHRDRLGEGVAPVGLREAEGVGAGPQRPAREAQVVLDGGVVEGDDTPDGHGARVPEPPQGRDEQSHRQSARDDEDRSPATTVHGLLRSSGRHAPAPPLRPPVRAPPPPEG
jgi:hypothetical protein